MWHRTIPTAGVRLISGRRDILGTGKSAEAKTGGAVVRVDEDGGDARESEVARDRERRVVVHIHRSRLQPLPVAKSNGESLKMDAAAGNRSNRTVPNSSQTTHL
jgi:hypothetical protein